ncbi:MAG: roadblock/LC7 domain-containing protein [Thermoplasmata archaeon]|nr:roadblock/LC7 domain-containing protein [Thermoplasmata archaeon]
MSLRGDLYELLAAMQAKCGYDGAAVLKKDGTLLASYLPSCANPDVFSIMSATMIGAAETAKTELKISNNLEEIKVKAGSKVISAKEINKELLFVCLSTNSCDEQLKIALPDLLEEIKRIYTQNRY